MKNITIPYLDLKTINLRYADEFSRALSDVLENDILILGEGVSDFENAFASYCSAKFCVGVGSGLSALEIALKALGIQPGDEVIVPANTYIATWLAVTNLGAIPKPLDPTFDTALLAEERILESVSDATKCVILVDLYGATCYTHSLYSHLKKSGIPLVIDAAQSHGAKYMGEAIGGLADITCWSFYPGKNLGALGDGGALTCNNAELADKARLIRNYGSKQKYKNECIGTNSRLDTIQAKFLQIKLKDLDAEIIRRNQIAKLYRKHMSGKISLLKVPDNVTSAWHIFPVFHPERDKLQAYLADNGIGTIIHYPIPPYAQACYASFSFDRFPVSNRLHQEELSLPCNSTLSDADVLYIADKILKFNC